MSAFVNLTPHSVEIIGPEGILASIPPSGSLARVTEQRHPLPDDLPGIPVSAVSSGAVSNLPEPADGVVLIVSRVTAAACPGRSDVYFPLDEVRDDQGRIIGCRALGKVTERAEAEQ